MENLVNIVNTINQSTILVNNLKNEITQEAWNEASLQIDGGTFEIGGENNSFSLNAASSSTQAAEIMGEAVGVVEHTADLVDSVMFDIANNGFSQQVSDMTSSATASSTTELEASGIGVAAASVGINNTVCTNVNNSIRNVFSMAVNNNMSSSTQRKALAESINDAVQSVNQLNKNKATLKISNATFKMAGKANELAVEASATSGLGAKLQSTINSNMTASLTATSNNCASATSTVEASQSAKSSATASASQTQSTKVSTDAAIWAVAACVIVGAICMGAIGVAKCKSKANNQNATVSI